MYTTTIGRSFLNKYNDENHSHYTPEEFFDNVFYPLFFDHKKYMMTAGDSPLENPKISWEKIMLGKTYDKKHKKAGEKYVYETKEERNERYRKFKNDKVNQLKIDASTALGYPTLENLTRGTTGQISSLDISYSKDDFYLSWIGGALSLGIKGGLSILFNEPSLLMDIYHGWYHYRDYLEKNEMLKGNQINTWNSLWLSHFYDSMSFQNEYPTYGIQEPTANNNGIMQFEAASWVELLTKIAQRKTFDNIIGYIYKIGKSNTTIGFIPFNLEQIKRPHELYKKLFGNNQYLQNKDRITQLFGGGIGFVRSCQKGEIGIEALMPEGLSQYMKDTNLRNQKTGADDSDRIITFNTYKTWVVAMLNNEELWEKTKEFAVFLNSYASEGDRKKTDKSHDVKELLEKSNKRAFIESLTTIISKSKDSKLCQEMAYDVHKMSADDVKYLITLIKLHYETVKQSQ